MTSVRILHASDLHISIYKNEISTSDKFSHLLDTSTIGPWEFAKLARQAFKAFRKKMTASSYEPEVLKRLAYFIYDRAREITFQGRTVVQEGVDKIDAVVLSGDLATTGNDTDIMKVKEFLSSPSDARYPYENLNHEATLNAVKTPVWFLPGNHDRFQPTTDWTNVRGGWVPVFFYPGATNFDARLLDFKTNPVAELGAIPNWDTGSVPLRVVVIAADFSLKQFVDHEGIYGWLAQGRVYEDDDDVLPQLVAKTEDVIGKHKALGNGVLCLLWAVHFPPGFPHISRSNRLLFEERLIEKASQCGVRALLAGHTHEQVRYRKPGMDFDVVCCGTTTQHIPRGASARNRFQIIDISSSATDGIRIEVENYQYLKAGQAGASMSYFYRED